MASFDLTYNKSQSFKSNLFHVFTLFIELAKEIESLIGPENHMISYYQTILDGAIRSNEIKEKMTNYYSFWVQRLGGWIKLAQSNSEIRKDLDPKILSKHICSLMEGIMIIYSFQNLEKDLEKYFNDIFYQFFELIKNNNINEKK